jgi:hypothetical protein
LAGDTRIDGSPSTFEPHPVPPMDTDWGCPTEKLLVVAAWAVGELAVAMPTSADRHTTPRPDVTKRLPFLTHVPSQPVFSAALVTCAGALCG